jgi:hypothetical protein
MPTYLIHSVVQLDNHVPESDIVSDFRYNILEQVHRDQVPVDDHVGYVA